MSRIVFDNSPAPTEVNLGRADVACFVGLVRVLFGATLPANAVAWLRSLGYPSTAIAGLRHVPVLVETYAAFASVFDDGRAGNAFGTDYLATAVRNFFAQGGRRCYVVSTGDPVSNSDTPLTKTAKLKSILPNPAFSFGDASTWTGVHGLTGLEDVSFLLTPDLPILCASDQHIAKGQTPQAASGPEQFVTCGPADITPQPYRVFKNPAPRLQASDYTTWAASISAVVNYLALGPATHQLQLREIQFVAAFPIPQHMSSAAAQENPSGQEAGQNAHAVMSALLPETVTDMDTASPTNISSAFLQLSYPWLKTSHSDVLLEGLEPPDGALAGLLARNALTRGTFLSATKVAPAEVYDVSPVLPDREMRSLAEPLRWGLASGQIKPLITRLSLFGMTPSGIRLLSDVTAYPGETFRSAPVSRLVSVIARAARNMGQSMTFQNNGPELWGRVQRVMRNLLTRMWRLNALAGSSASEAFQVRCDRTTMTQNDLDNGRAICEVSFTAAANIEVITVKLAMEASGTSVQDVTASLAEVS